MDRFITYIVTLGLIFCSSFSLQAQERNQGLQANVNIISGLPMGDFDDNLNQAVPGFSVSFGGETPGLPLELGTELGFMSFGSDDLLELRVNNTNVPVQTVTVESRSKALMGHLVARLTPSEGTIRPYADALAGVRYFFSDTNIESEALSTDNNLFERDDVNRFFSTANFDSFAFSAGVGAGVEFLVTDGPIGMHNRDSSVLLQLGARYLFGTEAEYLIEDSIRRQNGSITFDVAETNTHMVVPQFGLKIST